MVMLFNNVDKSTKLEILQENIPKHEKDIYEALIVLEINPVTFDENSFEEEDPSIDLSDLRIVGARGRLKKGLDALNMIKQEIASLEA
jgi:hypothetical protein